jgi:hypothetical protein
MENSGAPLPLAEMDAKAVQPLTRTLKENGASAYSMAMQWNAWDASTIDYTLLHFPE